MLCDGFALFMRTVVVVLGILSGWTGTFVRATFNLLVVCFDMVFLTSWLQITRWDLWILWIHVATVAIGPFKPNSNMRANGLKAHCVTHGAILEFKRLPIPRALHEIGLASNATALATVMQRYNPLLPLNTLKSQCILGWHLHRVRCIAYARKYF